MTHFVEVVLLGIKSGEDMVEAFCGSVTILFESFNSKVFDGRSKAVKAALDPRLLDGNCFLLLKKVLRISVKLSVF